MNKPTKVHIVWGLVAVLAFLAGYFVLPSGSDGPPVSIRPGSSDSSSGDKAGISSGKADSAAGESATGSKSIGKDEVTRMLAEKITLSEADIDELGQTFRKSSDPVAQRLAFSKLIQGLTADNALLIREQIEHKDHRSAEFQEFHYAWGAVAGVDAVIFGVDTKEDDMKPALAGWAGASPQEAMAWIEGLDMANDARFDPLLKDRKLEVAGLRHHLMS